MFLNTAMRSAIPRHRPLPTIDHIEVKLLSLLSQSTGARPRLETQKEFLLRSIAVDADLRTIICRHPVIAHDAARRMPVQSGLMHDVLDELIRDRPRARREFAAA